MTRFTPQSGAARPVDSHRGLAVRHGVACPPCHAAVFLDRDGIIIEDRGHVRSRSDVRWLASTVDALQRLQRHYRLFIVTNQGGIGEGVLSAADVDRVHRHVLDHLAQFGIRIERVYCCPHRRLDGCRCIKPQPYFLHSAAQEFNIDLHRSFVVGDHPHDVLLAHNAGGTGIYVLTGHGARHRAELAADALVVADIGEAASLILKRRAEMGREQAPSEQIATTAMDVVVAGQPVVRGTAPQAGPRRSGETHVLLPVQRLDDIPIEYRQTPIGRLLQYHNLASPLPVCRNAELLVGMCMDNRKHLRIPDNFAFIIRSGGANLRYSEFTVAYAIAVGGVRAIALIGHTNCGMVSLASRREQFAQGLVENGGWQRASAEQCFDALAPTFEIGNEIDFILFEAQRLRVRFPKVLVAPMIYKVEDSRLYLVQNGSEVLCRKPRDQ